jgi:hypothetical protein
MYEIITERPCRPSDARSAGWGWGWGWVPGGSDVWCSRDVAAQRPLEVGEGVGGLEQGPGLSWRARPLCSLQPGIGFFALSWSQRVPQGFLWAPEP